MLAQTTPDTARAAAAVTYARGTAAPGVQTMSPRRPGVIASTASSITVLTRIPTTPKTTVHTSARPNDASPLVQMAVNTTAPVPTSQAAATSPADPEASALSALPDPEVPLPRRWLP